MFYVCVRLNYFLDPRYALNYLEELKVNLAGNLYSCQKKFYLIVYSHVKSDKFLFELWCISTTKKHLVSIKLDCCHLLPHFPLLFYHTGICRRHCHIPDIVCGFSKFFFVKEELVYTRNVCRLCISYQDLTVMLRWLLNGFFL